MVAWWLFTVYGALCPPVLLFPFVPSFPVPSFPSSSLRPFTLSSHRHSIRSIPLLLLVGVAFYLMATGLFKQTIDCLQQVLERHNHGTNKVLNCIRKKKKNTAQTERTRTPFRHTYFDLDLPVPVISVFQRHQFGRRQ